MIDIHHHLLWGLDDGSTSLENSVAMAKMAAADGITHVVCTPHANEQFSYDPKVIAQKVAELQLALDMAGVDLKLGQGSDFHMSYDNIQEAKVDPRKFSINGHGYLLIELPDYGISRNLTETLYQLQLAGLTPILTHPERNATLQADEQRMVEWMRGGLLVQITTGSVTGSMGKTAQRMAHRLLENRWVHFLATDAHNTTSRPPKMREAHDMVAEKYGPEYAHALCVGNPLAAFKGKPLMPQAEPLHIFDDMEVKKGWWGKMFGRS
jgi:protein-tyrosine phosphatase